MSKKAVHIKIETLDIGIIKNRASAGGVFEGAWAEPVCSTLFSSIIGLRDWIKLLQKYRLFHQS